LAFAGASASSPVAIAHGRWPLATGLPRTFGPVFASRATSVLLDRHVAPPEKPPVFVAEGPAGLTPMGIAVNPGSCYLAITAVHQGNARALTVRARLGAEPVSEERAHGNDASLIAFCVGRFSRARLDVDARGTGIMWGTAVYEMRSGVWEQSP
jgi:hypothetical protein